METWFVDIYAQYPVLAAALFVVLRAVPVIVPPLPGLALDLVGVALFGWKFGFVLGYLGVLLGSAVSFYIARILRERAVSYFVSLQQLHEFEARYPLVGRFWSLVGLRLATAPFFDVVNYVAGLTTIRGFLYLAATAVSTAPLMFAIYYFGGLSFGLHPLVAFVFFVLLVLLAGAAGSYVAVKKK